MFYWMKKANYLNQLTYLTLFFVFFMAPLRVFAAPVVVTEGPVVFDWGRLLLRYQGYDIPGDRDKAQFTELESSAFFRGLTQVRDPLNQIYQGFLAENELKAKAKEGDKLAPEYERYSFITERVFFANSGLNVAILSPMTRLFTLPEHFFKPVTQLTPESQEADNAQKPLYTGVLLDLNQATRPKAIYRIVDEEYNVLFSYADLSHEKFAKNLMGRWYHDPSMHEIRAVAGSNPARLKLKVLREGLFQFDTRGSSMGKDQVIELLSQGKLMLKF